MINLKNTSLVIASSNKNKIIEMQPIKNLFKEIITTDEKYIPPIEDGKTFAENAFIKASYASKLYNMPALADDSGICLPELANIPGIKSARIIKECGSVNSAVKYLFDIYDDTLEDNPNISFDEKLKIKSYFYCSLCLVIPNEQPLYFEGKINGSLVKDPMLDDENQKTFGYDPYFIADKYELSFSQMPDVKKKISHRSIALNKLTTFMKSKYL